MKHEHETAQPAHLGQVERGVGRPAPKRAGFLEQIEACRREVAKWPKWMRATRTAPARMEWWDD